VKTSCLGVRNNKNPASNTAAECTVPLQNAPKSVFANISQSMRPREKLEEAKNVPREISYRIGHSRVSLCLPISLKLHSNEYKKKISAFFHVFGNFFANISRSMRPRGKIVGVENVPRKISYRIVTHKLAFAYLLT